MSLTSSLLPLLLLSFFPSSSPLPPPCPHLIPFSSLFPPLFCRVRYLFKRCFVMICTLFPRIRSNDSPFFPSFALQLTKRSNKRDGRAGYISQPHIENHRPRYSLHDQCYEDTAPNARAFSRINCYLFLFPSLLLVLFLALNFTNYKIYSHICGLLAPRL